MSNARTQYQVGPADLETVLALSRGGTLAAAGERLGVDASTVFRSLQRLERGVGRALFDRSRAGYRPTELAQILAAQGEQVEAAIEAARSATESEPAQVTGTVRLTTTDSVLHGLVAPALKGLQQSHPLLHFELLAGNELASLTRRDADIAVRATKRPPQHLMGRQLGVLRVAMYGPKRGGPRTLADVEEARAAWIGVDDALPEHPSVTWRKRHYPKVTPSLRVNSIVTVAELVSLGLGVGILPLFLAERRSDLRRLSEPLDDAQTELWLLTHPEARHLRRISAVYSHLAQSIVLP
jgi:DNA-binding transcriptional LysR family regulator